MAGKIRRSAEEERLLTLSARAEHYTHEADRFQAMRDRSQDSKAIRYADNEIRRYRAMASAVQADLRREHERLYGVTPEPTPAPPEDPDPRPKVII